MISVLRKYKYLLNRQTLLKIYVTFIRPVLEYASEVWDGCSKVEEDNIEKVQLEAARLITGLPRFASRNALYNETGLPTLALR